MNISLAAIFMAALSGTVVDKTAPDTAVRLVTGKELSATLQKGMTPDALFSQVIIAKHANYQIYTTARDKSGQSEVHASWNDNIFIQEGEASFILGGAATDAKEREPGEMRGSVINGGTTTAMKVGDYLFIPAGVPHQMTLKAGQRVKFIAFKTHK
jgi:uncharacterized RmlC-like cupin family protein